MGWQISKLNVDVNTDHVEVVLATVPIETQTIALSFQMPENMKMKPHAAQTLDNVSRAALIAQAKKVLLDGAGSL